MTKAEYDLSVVCLASMDARVTSLPKQNNAPSRLDNRYLHSVD
jgi:hypothetical protein